MNDVGIHIAAADVVDYLYAVLLDAHPCHRSAKRVDAHGSFRRFLAYFLECHPQQLRLFLLADGRASRSCGTGTDVDDGSALRHDLSDALAYGISSLVMLVEGVGRDVEYAHDYRRVQFEQFAADIDGVC